MKRMTLTAPKLRLILSITLVLIFMSIGGVFYFAYRRLQTMPADVATKVADANDSQSTLQQLQKLKQNLETDKDSVARSGQIAADGQDYAYQDRIVSDLTAYATRSGMAISNIVFSSTQAGTASTPGQTSAAPAGLRTTNITVTLKNPANYRDLLNFLHYIEQNLTKMKVANVTLTKSDKDTVTTDSLNLEVYLR